MIMPDTSTILIVDDDRGGREALEALLLTQGYTLILASSGQDALRKLSEKQVDLVLLDVMMPGMDGYEVCRRIRNDPALADIPVMMLTALNDYRSRLAGFEVGADDYITKPYDSSELFARVRTITRLNRYRRQVAERAKFQQLFDLSPNGQLVIDADGKVLLTNKKMLELLGIASVSESTNRDLASWIESEHRAELVALWSEFWQHPDQDFHVETWLAPLDGAARPVELLLGRIDFAGKPAAQVIVIDIHERMQLAGALAREQTLLKTLLEILPDYVFCKDLEGRYVVVNPAMAGLLGLESSADAVGKTDFDFYPKELAMRYSSDEQHMLATGKPITAQEEPAVDAHGNWLVISATRVVLRDKDGEPVGLMGFGKDLTGLRKVERERDQAQAERAAGERLVEELKAHDLKCEDERRQFLASLGDQVARLGQDLDKEISEAHETAEENPTLRKTVATLLAVARDLNEYTRLAKSPVDRSSGQFSLAGCVRSAVELAAGAHSLDTAQVDISLAENLPDQVAGNRDGLGGVITRLLNKILGQEKIGRPSIQVEEENYDALRPPNHFHVHVMVAGTELKLKNEELPDVFVPYRGPLRDAHEPGLDLAICKRLVEGAGGGIWIENQDLTGRGLAFHFTFPLDIP